jgi:hypothetical protein
MRRIRGHNGGVSRSEPALLAVNHQHDGAGDHVPDLFLVVMMLVEVGRAG